MSRVVLLFKMIARELRRMIHPRSISTVKFEGKDVDEQVQSNVAAYFSVYMICVFIIFVILSLQNDHSMETNFSATIACFNNIGPGFAEVGPMSSYASYSDISKIVLCFAMLLGRLEIFPILIAMIPSTWTKKY